MTRRKALLQVFVLLGMFVCFLLAMTFAFVSGLLVGRPWAALAMGGCVITTVILSRIFKKNREALLENAILVSQGSNLPD